MPTSPRDWEDESLLPQLPHMHFKCGPRLSCICTQACKCVVHQQHIICHSAARTCTAMHKAQSVSLTDDTTEIGCLDRGVPLFGSQEAQEGSSVVQNLHMVHSSVHQVTAIAKAKKLRKLFHGSAGVEENLQPARLLLGTGAETKHISTGFVRECSLAVSSASVQADALVEHSIVLSQMTAKTSIKIGALLQKKLICRVNPMFSLYNVIPGKDSIAAQVQRKVSQV